VTNASFTYLDWIDCGLVRLVQHYAKGMFVRLRDFSRIATRYDRMAKDFLAATVSE